ncbi:homoprotocatechuate degradation operon regulator HpaR [Castellaniella sp.]|uniref:homoprotocatechuate degradation operon regulator HpaR n=1 Tax=Castellaniella sp. TaxID=1955812 RepID=UPI00356290D4
MLLLRAREKLMAHFRPLLRVHGLSDQQWRIIRALHEFGPLESRLVSDICSLSTPSLAGILNRMQALGLVHKERQESDQRRVIVSLTDKSQALVEQISDDIETLYAGLEHRVGQDLLARLYQATDELVERLDDMAPLS